MAQKKINISELEHHKTQKNRLKNPQINKAIYGLLAWFEDTQIRDRKGEYSSLYHYSEAPHPARSTITYWPSFLNKQGFKIPMFLKVRNIEGEWASQMHAFPNLLGSRGKTPITVQDSNMFITGTCAISLLLVDESKLKQNARIIEPMLKLTQNSINSFKRGNSYNFWPVQEAVTGNIARTGPMNIWIEIAEPVLRRINGRVGRSLLGLLNNRTKLKLPQMNWLDQVLNNPQNKQGVDAIFNIPNDANDTALAITLEFLFQQKISAPLRKSIDELCEYRDQQTGILKHQRNQSDYQKWLPDNSGAFLTWLKQESNQVFKHPQQGLIPDGINNVDLVINANVLYMLTITGNESKPGFTQSLTLLYKAIIEKQWPNSGLYYPQQLMFPYAISRVFRNTNITTAEAQSAKQKLLTDVLELAKVKRKYIFYKGGEDKSHHLPTALALCTLLNLGESVAREIKQLDKYTAVIEGCLAFLLKEVRYKSFLFETTREKFNQTPWAQFISHWEDGLFFGPVHWDLCHWRTQAITHSVILEALCKYLCLYDKDSGALINKNCKLLIKSYTREALEKQDWLSVQSC